MPRILTPKSNLETLRKDAKRWLKALRSGSAQAQKRLLAAWPDAPAEVALRDVQHALAREYACESWIGLKAALDDLALQHQSRGWRVEHLLRHAWDGDPVLARRILERDPSIARDSLFTAAVCGDVAEVERHLMRDPKSAQRTTGKVPWTALTYVTYGRLDPVNAVTIARLLLDAGADPNFGFDDGWGTPFKVLTGAIRLGEGARPSHPQAAELIKVLIEAGAESYDSQSLYNVSIVGDDTHWYEVLWQYAEAANGLDNWRVKAAGRLGDHLGVSTLDYLLGNAVSQNHLARAEWLLARGANANTAHAYHRRPVHAIAQMSGFLDMVAMLERHGATPVRLEGLDAFRAAVLGHDETDAKAVLAEQPALIEHPGPLLTAAEFGDAMAIDLLLHLGAAVQGVDHDGISPLHRAVQSGSLKAVDRLLAAGAEIDLREKRWNGTPLTWSRVLHRPHLTARLAPLSRDVRGLCWLGLTERLSLVLAEEPARISDSLPEDESPTLLFCLPDEDKAASDVVRILMAYGADPNVRNRSGKTAVDMARLHGLDEAADLMEPDHA